MDQRQESWASWLTICLVLLAVAAGCQLTPAPVTVSCPLPVNQQVTAVLEVVPLGTPRDEVAAKLKAAGVLGSFNDNRSIYYCDLWAREGGHRWHINVALLFDEDGTLYATRPDSQGQLNPTPQTTAKDNQPATASEPRSLYD